METPTVMTLDPEQFRLAMCNGVKANYEDDSSQSEMVGGTRLSERKSPTRRAATPA